MIVKHRAARIVTFALAAVATCAGVSACGSGRAGSATGTPPAHEAASSRVSSGATTVHLEAGSLLDRADQPLYRRVAAVVGGLGSVTCSGTCSKEWAALTLPPGQLRPSGPPELSGTLGVVPAASGGLQVTYRGSPLYRWTGPGTPGPVAGWVPVIVGSPDSERVFPVFRRPSVVHAGQFVTSPAGSGRPAVVVFFSSWCTGCPQELHVAAAAARHAPSGVRFVAVDVNDQPGAARRVLAAAGVAFPVAADPTDTLALRAGVTGLPAAVVVDRSARVVAVALGVTTRAWLRQWEDRVR